MASITSYYSIGCTKSKAIYSLNVDGSIHVENSCIKFGFNDTINGKAVPNDATNAKLTVTLGNVPVAAAYWIVRLAEDFSYAVVSDGKR